MGLEGRIRRLVVTGFLGLALAGGIEGCKKNSMPPPNPLGASSQATAAETPQAVEKTVIEIQRHEKEFDRTAKEILKEKGISLDLANQYDDRFMWSGNIIEAVEANLAPTVANRYDDRFRKADHILEAWKGRMNPEVANAYAKEFGPETSLIIFHAGILPDTANGYIDRISWRNRDPGSAVIGAFQAEVTPEIAKTYRESTRLEDITKLYKAKISQKLVDRYGFAPLDAVHAIHLRDDGISAQLFKQYDSSFFREVYTMRSEACDQIIALHKASISPEEANRYAALNEEFGSSITGFDIVSFQKWQIPYERVAEKTKELALEHILVRE